MTSKTLQKLLENTQHCLELLDKNNETLSCLLENLTIKTERKW